MDELDKGPKYLALKIKTKFGIPVRGEIVTSDKYPIFWNFAMVNRVFPPYEISYLNDTKPSKCNFL